MNDISLLFWFGEPKSMPIVELYRQFLIHNFNPQWSKKGSGFFVLTETDTFFNATQSHGITLEEISWGAKRLGFGFYLSGDSFYIKEGASRIVYHTETGQYCLIFGSDEPIGSLIETMGNEWGMSTVLHGPPFWTTRDPIQAMKTSLKLQIPICVVSK